MTIDLSLAKKIVKAVAEFEGEAAEREARMKADLKRAQALGFAKPEHELTPEERFKRDAAIAMEANGGAAGSTAAKLILPAILKLG